MDNLKFYDYILYGLLAILLIITSKIGLVKGLLLGISIIFIYGSVIFFQIMTGSVVIWRINYGILIGYNVCIFWVGLIHDGIDEIYRSYQHFFTKGHEIINVDDITGYGTEREFYKDLDVEMAKARRYKNSLSLGILQIQYYFELLSLLGKDEMDLVFKMITETLNNTLRIEDMKYRIEKNMIALILPHTNLEGAEIIRGRIKGLLQSIQVEKGSLSKKVTIELKIGLLGYEEHIKNSFDFKRRALKELEYDV